MQTNSAVEQNKNFKNIKWSRIHRVRLVGREKDLPKSKVLSSQWKTEQVKEDGSGDSEDGEDDEQPCVIRESEGDCVWQGSRRSVGSTSHTEGAAYWKEKSN